MAGSEKVARPRYSFGPLFEAFSLAPWSSRKWSGDQRRPKSPRMNPSVKHREERPAPTGQEPTVSRS